MKIPLIDQYSKEELGQIVSQSSCIKQVIDKLGYSTHSGNNRTTVKKRIIEYGIDISHFCNSSKGLVVRSDEQVFIQNSNVSQHCLRNRVLSKQLFPYVCSICGQLPKWNGKQLPLILDHINGRNHDNRLENLRWVCPNCNQQLPTTGFKKISSSLHYLEKHYYCKDCGKQITSSSKSGYCKSCCRTKKIDQMLVSRDELKALIRTTSFTAIGRKYGVTDNTVRKWCVKYRLPSKSLEIKK